MTVEALADIIECPEPHIAKLRVSLIPEEVKKARRRAAARRRFLAMIRLPRE